MGVSIYADGFFRVQKKYPLLFRLVLDIEVDGTGNQAFVYKVYLNG